MRNDLGLPSLLITQEREFWDEVEFDAEPAQIVCPKCGNANGLSDPILKHRITVNDTPSRGKPASLHYLLWRSHCSPCHHYFDASAGGIDLKRRMTDRLIAYIEAASTRRTQAAIAAEVGVSADRVRRLVNGLADRLAKGHKFPTPRVLGLDDLKMNRKLYTIVTDAETGRAIGLIEGCKADLIIQWVRNNLTVSEVKVVVSDLGAALISAAARPELAHTLHVADRWHLLQGCQQALSKVIYQELARLAASSATDAKEQAKTLRSHRQDLLGRRRTKVPASKVTLFDDKLLQPMLESNERLRGIRKTLG